MFINDSVHGLIKLTGLQQELMMAPEIQRLQWIKQLGLAFLCYPGAVHTRISHSLGVSYLANRIATYLNFNEDEIRMVEAAGLLHDIGHLPFSHTLESILERDHMEITRDIVIGRLELPIKSSGQIPKILKKYGLDPERVGDLITSRYDGKGSLQSIIFGDCDADQLDYLIRDAYFCGVSHGNIDIYRIIYTMVLSVKEDKILILEKGIPAIEEMLVARDHMYSAVYTHKTARIAELMLLRAVESAMEYLGDFYHYIDAQLITELRNTTDIAKNVVDRLISRNLYKAAYRIYSHQLDMKEIVIKLSSKYTERELESIIIKESGLKNGDVFVDLPIDMLNLSEPRLKEINIKILTKNYEIKDLIEVSPLTKSLLMKESTQLIFGVYTAPENREIVKKIVIGIIDEFK